MTIDSGRTDGDTWGPASSVGATATMVALSRALASQGPDALLNDPLADPLVRAVGLDPFVRMIDGKITLDDDPLLRREALNEQIAVRTRFFDDFFTAATDAGMRQAVILASGLDTRAYRLRWPEGMVVYEIDQPQVIDFKTTHAGRPRRRPDRRPATRSASICATTGRPRCGSTVLTSANRRRGLPRACWSICRPKLRIDCSTASLRSARRAAELPPSTCPIPRASPVNACSGSPSAGIALGSTSICPT